METHNENVFWLVFHLLLSILLLSACDAPSGVTITTTPAATATTAPATTTAPVSDTPSCPAVFTPPTQGQAYGPPSFWVCDSGCGSLPFDLLIFQQGIGPANGVNAWVSVGYMIGPTSYGSHAIYAMSTSVFDNGELMFGSSAQPWSQAPVGTGYTVQLNCTDLIVDGVTFTYTTSP